MGLADQLFAGLGQGLASGVQNYNQGLAQQRQDTRQAEADQRAREQWLQQQQIHGQQMAAQRVQGLQASAAPLMKRARAGDEDAARQLNSLVEPAGRAFSQAYGLEGVTMPTPAQGSPIYGRGLAASPAPSPSASLGVDPITQDPGGILDQRLGLAAGAPTEQRRSFANEKTLSYLSNALHLPDPKVEYKEVNGTLVPIVDGRLDPTGAWSAPAKQEPYTLGPDQVRVDPKTGIIARGPARTFAPQQNHFSMTTYTDPETGEVKLLQQNTATGAVAQTNILGRQPVGNTKFDKNWNGYKAVAPYEDYIQKAAAANGLDPALLRSIVWQESKGNPKIRGGDGEYGLMQLMPDTLRDLGIPESRAFDPETNIMGGAKWLAMKIKQQGGDVWEGVRAYNGSGQGARNYRQLIRGHYARFQDSPTATNKPMTRKQVIDEVDAALRPEKPNPVMSTPDEVAAFQSKRTMLINKRLRETAAGGTPAQAPAAQKPQSADDAAFTDWVNKKLGGP